MAAVLGIELKHATTKHAQTKGLLDHNTTYHASLGCEPSRIFNGRISHNMLDYKLSYNPNPKNQP